MGWVCKKAVWQWTDAYTCNTASGKWKDDNVVTTYHCALEENKAIAAPEHICNHWWAKPATTTVVKWEASCNTPQWETNWNCPNPNCNISRIAGKCGGVTESVTCTQYKKDRAGTIHETRTQIQQKACTRACETAACGSANGVATKYQPTALCAAGTASAVGGNPSIWSWTCAQLDGAKNCSATKIPLQAGSCGSSHNINHNALNAGSANLCNYGSVISFNENGALYTNRWSWKCRGDDGAHNQDANCIAHKPAPQAGRCAQALNTCMVGTVKDQRSIANGKRWSCEGPHGGSTDTTCSLCDNGYIYDSVSDSCKPKCGAGYTLQDGICVKWDCRTTPPSTGPGRCENKSNYKYIETEGYRFIEWEVGRVSWQVACDTMEEAGLDPSEAFMLRITCPQLWYWLYDSLWWNERHFTWWFDDWNRKMSVKVPSGTPFGNWNVDPYIEWDFLYDPTDTVDNLIWEYENSQHTGSPYRGIVLNENQKEIHFCENLDFSKRHIPIFSAQTDYSGRRYPMCQENTDCTGKNQTQCTNLSQICKWRPSVTIPGRIKTICIDEQWNTRPDAYCANAEAKSCTPPKVNGLCKTYAWTHASQPATNTANGCVAGDYEDIPDDSNNRKWKCNGKNGGTEDICSVGKLTCNSDEEASTIEQVWNTNQCRILSTPKCMKKSITVNYTGNGCWDCPFGNYREGVYRWYRYYCKDLDAKVMCWRRPKGWHRGHFSSTPPKITDLEWSHTQHYNLEIFKQQCKKV